MINHFLHWRYVYAVPFMHSHLCSLSLVRAHALFHMTMASPEGASSRLWFVKGIVSDFDGS